MTAALIACTRIRGPVGSPLFLLALGAASAAYLLTIRELLRTQKYARHVIFVCVAMAVVWRIPFLMVMPGPDDDVLRYVWDGRVQQFGYNPYTAIPADPTLAGLNTAETRRMNNPDVPSPYPAGAQLFFRAVTAIDDSAFAFKIVLAACDFAIALILWIELRRVGRGEHWVLAYAWHPLLITCVAYSSHIDILGVLLLLISVTALNRNRRTLAATMFAASIAVKFVPVVLAPLYWRRVRIRDALIAVFLVLLLYAPFLRGPIPLGSLGTYVQRFRFNDPIFAGLERFVQPQAAAGVAVCFGLLMALRLRYRHATGPPDVWAWPMAVSLVAAPVVYPWYLIWLIPFLQSASALPLMTWTLSILSVFFVWYSHAMGQAWRVPGWILLLEYGAAAIALAIAWFHYGRSARNRRPALHIASTSRDSSA